MDSQTHHHQKQQQLFPFETRLRKVMQLYTFFFLLTCPHADLYVDMVVLHPYREPRYDFWLALATRFYQIVNEIK